MFTYTDNTLYEWDTETKLNCKPYDYECESGRFGFIDIYAGV